MERFANLWFITGNVVLLIAVLLLIPSAFWRGGNLHQLRYPDLSSAGTGFNGGRAVSGK